MRYEIDENNAVFGYVEGQEEPCLQQPNHPDGSAWIDRADAQAWAELWLAHIADSANNPFPWARS